MLSCPVHEMGNHAGDFKTPAQNCSVHELGTQSVLLFPISRTGQFHRLGVTYIFWWLDIISIDQRTYSLHFRLPSYLVFSVWKFDHKHSSLQDGLMQVLIERNPVSYAFMKRDRLFDGRKGIAMIKTISSSCAYDGMRKCFKRIGLGW